MACMSMKVYCDIRFLKSLWILYNICSNCIYLLNNALLSNTLVINNYKNQNQFAIFNTFNDLYHMSCVLSFINLHCFCTVVFDIFCWEHYRLCFFLLYLYQYWIILQCLILVCLLCIVKLKYKMIEHFDRMLLKSKYCISRLYYFWIFRK